jgi:hypothetical protein
MPRLVITILVLGVSLSALAALSAAEVWPIGPPVGEQPRPVALSDVRAAGEITIPLLVVQWLLWLGYRRAVVLYRRMRPAETHGVGLAEGS